jgi:hypothetical protein
VRPTFGLGRQDANPVAKESDPPASIRRNTETFFDFRLDALALIWGFDGKKYTEVGPIDVTVGERLRLTMINETMMTHPIHLHGMARRR